MKNISLKALVAAVALVGAAGQAQADILPGTNAASGANGSELVFYAFDDVTKTSYVKDLDSSLQFASFAAGPTYSYSFAGSNNVSSDANWASYLASVSNNLNNTYWGVFATLKTSISNVQILTTARGNTTAATTSGLVRGIDGSFNSTYLGGLPNGTNYAADDSYYRTGATNAGNWAAGMQHNLAGKVSFLADNKIGDNADFFQLVGQSSTLTNAVQSTVFSGSTQWAFDGNSLYITAAVPEPGTWAMLLAGLMMVGGIARRRMS